MNRRAFLRAVLGFVAAPIVAKVAAAEGEWIPGVVEAADLPCEVVDAEAVLPEYVEGEMPGREWGAIQPEVVIELDAKRDNVLWDMCSDPEPIPVSMSGPYHYLCAPRDLWDARVSFDAQRVNMPELRGAEYVGFVIRHGVLREVAFVGLLEGVTRRLDAGALRVSCALSGVRGDVTVRGDATIDRLLADIDRASERNAAMTCELLPLTSANPDRAVRDFAAGWKA